MNYDIDDDEEDGKYYDWDDIEHEDDNVTTGDIFVDVVKNNNSEYINDLPEDDELWENWQRVYTRGGIESVDDKIDNRHKTSTINFTEI